MGGDWGSVSVVRGAEHFLTPWILQGAFPCLGRKCQVLFRLIPESAVCCCRTTFIHCQGTRCSLSKWTTQAKGIVLIPGSHPPTAGLGSSTAHESSLALSTISHSKPNHETVLLLSDHVTSQKLCRGSTKSPVFPFAKLSQVIQSPECFFCQCAFAVIKLHSCEG